MAKKSKRRKLCKCEYRSLKMRCLDCGHRLTCDRTSHWRGQMDNLYAVVKERDRLRRLVELTLVEGEQEVRGRGSRR